MTTATVNISLPETIKEFIDTKLRAGAFNSTSEYVIELIRRDQITMAEAQLRDMLLAGINSGPSVRADAAFFERIRERAIPNYK